MYLHKILVIAVNLDEGPRNVTNVATLQLVEALVFNDIYLELSSVLGDSFDFSADLLTGLWWSDAIQAYSMKVKHSMRGDVMINKPELCIFGNMRN